MSRITFYRKYRSQTFSELVGQEHIVQTLTNAITNQRLSHAYIFSGPRGTGKTSIARIFAKALNIYETEQQLDQLTNELCQRINQGICVDIVEIDAASNTGVDNIRDLNEKVNFSPVECSYKFYIIDEAHMLSTGAFNALLKTMEEPPSNTIFILATTEPHKIPITIHSRCQHLRFRNLTDLEIKTQLQHVCDKESITISDNGLAILARNSSGCMRDGLSLLDQMYSFKGTNITDDDILKILGTADINNIATIFLAIAQKNSQELLTALKQLLNSGVNPLQLLKDLTQFGEQLLAFQSNYLDAVTFNHDTIKSITTHLTIPQTLTILNCLTQTESETRWVSNPGLLIEIRLMQLLFQNQAAPVQQQSSAQTQQQSPTVTQAPPHQPQQQKPTPSYQKPQAVTPTAAAKAPPIPTPPITNKPSQPKQQPASQNTTPAAQSLPDFQTQWNSFLSNLKSNAPNLYSILRESKIINKQDNKLQIELIQPIQFFIDKLNEQQYKTILENHLSKFFNQKLSYFINQTAEPVKAGTTSITQQAVVQNPATNSTDESQPQAQTAPEPLPTSENPQEKSIQDIITIFEGSLV